MEVGIPVHFNFDGDAMLLELQVSGDIWQLTTNDFVELTCNVMSFQTLFRR